MKTRGKHKTVKLYWAKRTLERKKVARLLRNRQPAEKGGEPMSPIEARRWWFSKRKRRIPDGFCR